MTFGARLEGTAVGTGTDVVISAAAAAATVLVGVLADDPFIIFLERVVALDSFPDVQGLGYNLFRGSVWMIVRKAALELSESSDYATIASPQ